MKDPVWRTLEETGLGWDEVHEALVDQWHAQEPDLQKSLTATKFTRHLRRYMSQEGVLMFLRGWIPGGKLGGQPGPAPMKVHAALSANNQFERFARRLGLVESTATQWVRGNCKFAQMGGAVTADHISQAMLVAVQNLLRTMGQNNPDIQSDIAEASSIIQEELRNAGPNLNSMATRLSQFFQQKSEQRAAPNPQAVQQAVQNPTAAPVPQ